MSRPSLCSGTESRAGRAVVLFAKAPVPGRVKTRLVPPLTPAEAAELQSSLLLDTADVVLGALLGADAGTAAYCAAAEPDDEPALSSLMPPAFAIVEQGVGDLGERLARVLGRLLERHAGVLALGADAPDLTPEAVGAGLAALSRGRCVLGPAQDGGYWAIGLTRADAAVFREIPWSTPRVAEATRRRFAARGLPHEELTTLRDVDVIADLEAWLRAPNAGFARTLAWCRARGLG